MYVKANSRTFDETSRHFSPGRNEITRKEVKAGKENSRFRFVGNLIKEEGILKIQLAPGKLKLIEKRAKWQLSHTRKFSSYILLFAIK